MSWHKETKKWKAQRGVQGKNVYLGLYADEEDAARAVAEYVERGVVTPLRRKRKTSEHRGVCRKVDSKKWVAQKMINGKNMHLGYYADEEDAARAVAEYVERGVVPPPRRESKTSEHDGVCWDKAAKKWKAQRRVQGKSVYLGLYEEEKEAARAVAEYDESGVVPPRRRESKTSEHVGVRWDKSTKKWMARRTVQGKDVYLGLYEEEEDAARAVAEYDESGVVCPPPRRRGPKGRSERVGVCWDKSTKKWKALRRVQGKSVYLGLYEEEEDAARAVAEYVERGVVPPRRRESKTSEHVGVRWDKAAKKWLARKTVEGKRKRLGLYEEEEDAARAVAEARVNV